MSAQQRIAGESGAYVPLPPILTEPGETRYEMFALSPEGRGGWPIDPRRAREFEDLGHRLFTREVRTTDWGEVTTRAAVTTEAGESRG